MKCCHLIIGAEVLCDLCPTFDTSFCMVSLTGPCYLPFPYSIPVIHVWYVNHQVLHMRSYSYNTFFPTHFPTPLWKWEVDFSVMVAWAVFTVQWTFVCVNVYIHIYTDICIMLVYRKLSILLKCFLLSLQLEIGRLLLTIAWLFLVHKMNACSHLWNMVCCLVVKYSSPSPFMCNY